MKLYCKVSRERVYRGQLPLHLVIGVNIIRRDLRVQWLRPAPAPPLVLALHSRTSVAVGRGGAGCGPVTVVSRGEEARSRVILDTEAALAGSRARAEIVDCEMEEVRGLQVTHCSLDTSASKSSIRMFVITEKAPTRAFSWLKAATTAFTFKTLLRY